MWWITIIPGITQCISAASVSAGVGGSPIAIIPGITRCFHAITSVSSAGGGSRQAVVPAMALCFHTITGISAGSGGSRQTIIASIAWITRTIIYRGATGVGIIPTRWTIKTPTIIAVPVIVAGVCIFTFGTILTNGVTGIGFLTLRTSGAIGKIIGITSFTSNPIIIRTLSTPVPGPGVESAPVIRAIMLTFHHVSRKSKIKNNEERFNNKFHFYSMRSIYIYII